ncbi:MAG: prenyltransferase [Syntrophomonadaceae bacterium]|nr:prenyltransferase [Syntrophomonadaceae bacterium]
MTELLLNSIPLRIRALYTLIRVLPVLSWGISASLLGLGFAYASNTDIRWLDYGLILLLIVLIHGVLSHAYNDREDWLSGTDQTSPGILSGGSRVINLGLYNLEELSWVGKSSIAAALLVGGFLFWEVGPLILIILAIGFWSAIAYSCAPLRLAYYPFAGEWLCGFPAVLTCAAGTFWVLTASIQPVILLAGGVHALLAIGLLMHHHLSDIPSDLGSSPPKLTTVALVSTSLGIKRALLVESFYFVLALIMGIVGTLYFHPVLWVTAPTALGCIGAALNTDAEDIPSITQQEYWLYFLIIGDAVVKTLLLFYCQG